MFARVAFSRVHKKLKSFVGIKYGESSAVIEAVVKWCTFDSVSRCTKAQKDNMGAEFPDFLLDADSLQWLCWLANT